MATPEEVAATLLKNVEAKTGRKLPAWLKLIKASGLTRHGEIMKLLKGEHGVTHGYANMIAHQALQAAAGGPASDDDLVAAQYSGPKADLRPIYDAVLAAAKKLGADVEVAPRKTYVSLRRAKQFAIVQPSTKTRVDLGLKLKDVKPAGRLKAAGSSMSMVSHKVELTDKKAVDAEVRRWLKAAYQEA